MKAKLQYLAVIAGFFLLLPSRALASADWIPLIQTASFEGVKTDLLTGANGLVLLFLIIFGVSMLLRVFR